MMDSKRQPACGVDPDDVAVPLCTVDLAAAEQIAVVDANRAALELFRAESAEDLGRQLARSLAPEATMQLSRLLDALRAGSLGSTAELELITPNGDRVAVGVTGRAIARPGQSARALLTIVDRGEARRARDPDESGRRHRAMLDGIPDLVFEIGADRVYRGFAGPEEAFSVPPAGFLGKQLGEVALVEIGHPVIVAIDRVRRTGEPETVEYTLPNGAEQRVLEVRVNPARRGGAVAVVRDATQRRETEKRLEESELRFRIMADYAPVLLWMSGTDGLCNFFNKVWLEFRGRTHEQERGTGWAAGVHPEDFQRCIHVYMDSFVTREPFRMEYRLRRADGEYRWILDEGVPRHAPDGSFAGFIGSCIDITELRELQTRLDLRVRERTGELAATVQELEAFCYSVSHDLRAPLRGIDGFCHALLEDYGELLDPRGHDYLRRARAAASRMGELIDGLLKLSRIGRAALRQVEIDLSGLAHLVAADLEKAYPERRVRFAIQDGLVARGDPLLRTVLENLLDNAVKFSNGSDDAVVEFGANRVGGQLIYFVRDNGVGFNMEYSKRLFGAFQRLHAASEFPGTGVGLASVQRVIHRHGGRVWAEAAEGRGATFYWTLPEAAAS
jgi:PAS domain S-box-containing protein